MWTCTANVDMHSNTNSSVHLSTEHLLHSCCQRREMYTPDVLNAHFVYRGEFVCFFVESFLQLHHNETLYMPSRQLATPTHLTALHESLCDDYTSGLRTPFMLLANYHINFITAKAFCARRHNISSHSNAYTTFIFSVTYSL